MTFKMARPSVRPVGTLVPRLPVSPGSRPVGCRTEDAPRFMVPGWVGGGVRVGGV